MFQCMPSAMHMLVERALSTDDLEGGFSLLFNGCGFKTTKYMAMGFYEHAGFLYLVRRDPESGVVLPRSSKHHYSYHASTAAGDTAWNDGKFVGPTRCEALMRLLEGIIDRARNVLGQKRDPTIRSYFQN